MAAIFDATGDARLVVILFRNRDVGMSPYPRLLPSSTGVSAPGEPTHRVVAVHPALDGVIPSPKPLPCAHTCDLRA
jgi:hypothetical protein